MKLRQSLAIFSLAVGLATPAMAQVKLERKLIEGHSRVVETTVKLDQKLSIAGMDTTTESDTRTVVKVSVGKRDGAGQLRVQEKIESLQISTKVMGTEYLFDSSNPDKAGGGALEVMRPLHKALSQRVTTTVYDKTNAVQAIEFDQDVLSQVSDDVRAIAKSQIDPENLKRETNEELKRLPDMPVKKGDSWERTEKSNLGAGQVMTIVTKYTYEGEVEKNGVKLDRISSKQVSVDFALEDSPLPFTVKSSDLKATEAKGELLFDRKLGQVVESTSSTRIVGGITFVVNNMDLPSKLDLKIEITLQPKS
jgi:Family of unknown function (DUF6263)